MCVRWGNMRQHREKKELDKESMDITVMKPHMYVVPSGRHPPVALKSYMRSEDDIKPKRKQGMAGRMSANFSDLIHRVAGSCLIQTIGRGEDEAEEKSESFVDDHDESTYSDYDDQAEGGERENESEDDRKVSVTGAGKVAEKLQAAEVLMMEVFEAVSAMKRAYVSLQAAHSPWDPEKMRAADAAVVAEFRRLGRLRERFRRGSPAAAAAAAAERAMVAYDPEVEELRKEVKEKEAQVENLRERLKQASGRKGRTRRASARFREVVHAPTPELFESCMNQVKEASKAFTVLLLSMMRSANWDIAAAVRSIEGGNNAIAAFPTTAAATAKHPHPTHAKHAIESYVCRKIFNGFENEAFYLSGSLTSLIHPEKHRRECFTQYRDMQSMDPVELLGILPDCQFGRFCGKKFLAIIHPKMEESFFGNLEQRRVIVNGGHPRTQFYGEFLALAKAVWLLHKLAFSLDPPPSHFQATKGAEFHPTYMESVVKFQEGVAPPGLVVGFPVSPGFKIGSFVIKSRVYLVNRTS
ncbi:unnamed protein product [Victoria cruziana]